MRKIETVTGVDTGIHVASGFCQVRSMRRVSQSDGLGLGLGLGLAEEGS